VSKLNVCVVGPRTLVGETLLEILEERSFPVAQLFLLDAGDEVAESATFAGTDYSVRDIASFDFSQARIAFFCGGATLSAEYAPAAAAAGCLVIDDSEVFRMDPEVPLVVPEVNGGALSGAQPGRILASPNTCATLLAMTLKPLADRAGLEGVNVVTLQSVSGTGRAAVEELARQSMALFNQNPMEPDVYPKQIAFNLLPQIGAEEASGYTREEIKVIEETRKLLGSPELAIDVTCVRVPVFYGHGIVVQARTLRALSREEARSLLDQAPGVVVYEEVGAGGCPTPVVEAASNDPVFVGRIRASFAKNAKGLSYWAVVDNMRKGAALNCIQIAENLIQNWPD
jgi:aspartate-semialdehyde dehydrogenase